VRAASELPRFAHLGILGRLPESFVALYDDSDLIILDQHAAHERLLFDRLMESRRSNETCGSQTLLIPHVVECDAVEARAIERHLELLQSVGFRIERFGEFDFAIKGVPEWWGGEDPERFIRSLADVFHDTGVTGNPDALREEMLKQMACKGAVKETGHLKPEEIRALLADLDAGGSAPVCPHGRPFVMRISFAEIRRRMGRK
jgi:DNA mismatch repair protein MutL